MNKRIFSWLVIIIPSAIFIFHASWLWRWIIDDAGIFFAYARNLAQGYGLVSQPSSLPVEGYSSFLWVIFLSPFFYFNAFDPIITTKLLSIFLVILFFVIMAKSLSFYQNIGKGITFIVLVLLALNSSFVIWTTSGLENALYVALIGWLFYQLVRNRTEETSDIYHAVILAVIVFLISITRPDGIIYFFIYPFLLLFDLIKKFGGPLNFKIKKLLAYSIIFAALFGGFIIFRLLYFKDILPNTYYVKVGVGLKDLVTTTLFGGQIPGKGNFLLTSVIGQWAEIMFIGLALITIYLIFKNQFGRRYFVLALFLALSVLDYIILPLDWMGELRFATPFFGFFYAYLVIIVITFVRSLNLKYFFRTALLVLILGSLVIFSVFMFGQRSIQFVRQPTVPFSDVAKDFGLKFNQYANQLGIKNGSIFLPDVGGTLYYSSLRVYDLVGLIDKTTATTLGRNQADFYDYVFEDLKPTFIHVHGCWSYLAALDNDGRFRRDYIPIYEYPSVWIKRSYGLTIYSGDYIRKDAISRDNLDKFQYLKINFRPAKWVLLADE